MTTNTENFYKDELEPPTWLNKDFLRDILMACENSTHVIVHNYQLQPASMKGEHYASIMFRIIINYDKDDDLQKSKAIIMKIKPETEGHQTEMLEGSNMFETEINVYSQLIPKFQEALQSANDNTLLAATCLYYSVKPKTVIVFEDLTTKGYNMIRKRHPNMQEAKGAYFKLAKLHALSYKMALEKPELFEQYRHDTFNNSFLVTSDFMTDGVPLFIEVISNIPTLSQYVPYFESLKNTLLKVSIANFQEYFVKRRDGNKALYALCHGDIHNNNVMYKHNADTGEFEEAMLIDFQTCYMGSIANDLFYAYFLILSPEDRLNHRDEMLSFYYDNFVQTLKQVGSTKPIPTFLDLEAELKLHKHYELFLMAAYLHIALAIRAGYSDIEGMLTNRNVRKELFYKNGYLDELHVLLPRYFKLGYFEN